jgi:hypothetical protein
MKRVWLREEGDEHIVDGKVFGRPELVRRASVALARYATDAAGAGGRRLGDKVFEAVTEGRASRPNYSTCGDLANWLEVCLGVRDETLVNRDNDGGDHPWQVGENLARVVYGKGNGFVWASGDAVPPPGAILYVCCPEHVCVLESWDQDTGEALTHDYGQWNMRFGGVCALALTKLVTRQGGQWIIGGRVLKGWLDVALLPLASSAIVPDDFEGGEALPEGSQQEAGIEVLR